MYVNAKLITVETIPGMGEGSTNERRGSINESGGEGESK
jgi:hypothetical protein